MKKLLFIFMLICSVSVYSMEENEISLVSEGTIEIMPNRAVFSFSAKNINTDRELAKKFVSDVLKQFIDDVLKMGLDTSNIATIWVSVQPHYTHKERQPNYDGEEVAHSLQVTLTNMKLLQKLYDVIAGNKNLDLNNVTFTHSKIDSLKNQAELIGIQNAIEKSKGILKMLNLKECKLINIRNYIIPNQDNYDKIDQRSRGIGYGGGGGDFIGGKQGNSILLPKKLEITQSVIVTFKMVQ